MSIVDTFARLLRKEAQHLTFVPIPAGQQQPAVTPVELKAERHYVRVWLAEMFLKDDRRLFNEYMPVVHSGVRLQFASRPAQELPYVAGPHNLGIDATGKTVQLNHPLTNLLPFRGGSVSITTALVAYKTRDYFQSLVEVLHDVSGLLNAGQLSATLKVVDSAVDGIQSLLGASEKDVRLLYFQSFAGETAAGGSELKSGYAAVIRAPANKLDRTQLFVRDSQLCYGRDLASAQPLTGYDYMLLRLEVAETRDDYLAFEEIGSLFHRAVAEAMTDRAKGDSLLLAAQVAAWNSPDLTLADRIRIRDVLRQEYEKIAGPPVRSGVRAAAPAAPDITSMMQYLNQRINAYPASEASRIAEEMAKGGAEIPLEDYLQPN